MTTWTNMDDSLFEPGKPARGMDGMALRDNPIAMAEGADGAPKIQTARANEFVSIAGSYPGCFYQIPGVVFTKAGASNLEDIPSLNNRALIIAVSGTITISGEFNRDSDFNGELEIYSGSSILATIPFGSTPAGMYTQLQQNVDVDFGQPVSIRCRRIATSGTQIARIRNLTFKSGNVAFLAW